MKGLIYSIIVAVPVIIIGSTIYLTRSWSPVSVGTIVTWFIAWVVSMALVTILYVKLMPRNQSSDDSENEATQNKEDGKRE
ncbi:hypothetical protein [Secundilactobacillus folii]|uniref:Uncharacterized protein n=1 Tax=Secundilactobacillus folii TaxID=2678357 RepID=A0A7X2XWN0_9LACO|nr:hypothetical protein [Secundilactobacillus folii]MTV83032.1 hypothetical protein [Secundilactobacillus folii]